MKFLAKLQSLSTHATLEKMGFKQNTAHAIAYGSRLHGGIGLRTLFIEQGIAQLTMIIRQIRSKNDLGTLAIIALS